MNFTIGNKEKFTVITPQLPHLDANMAKALYEAATEGIGLERGNCIVNMEFVVFANANSV